MKRDKKVISDDFKQLMITSISFVFGTFCLALCYNLFFVPNNIVVGGTSGIALILEKVIGWNSQILIYIFSFSLLIISYIFLGKERTGKTFAGSLLYPFFVTITAPVAKFLLLYLSFEEILVTVIMAGLLYGLSNGIIYKYGYTTGGSDVVMQILCKYCHFSEGKSTMIFNILVIIAGAFVFGFDNGVYAVLILVINASLVDKIIIGISDSKKFMIYTRKPKDIKGLIEREFHTGYTIFPTIGGYSHVRGAMIMCVITNRDVNLFKEKIMEIDETAFFVINDCYEVKGGIKRSNLPFI